MRRRGALAVLVLVAACSGGTGASAPSTAAPTAVRPVSPTGQPTPTATPAAPLRYALRRLAGFASPVWVGPAPGDSTHLYLAEKTGRLLRLDGSGHRQSTVLDLTGAVSTGSEQGLLSVAFDPGYAGNHRLYVDYTDTRGDTRVVAYTVSGGRAGSPQTLLRVDQPFENHNGGLLLFDGTGNLLVGLGDGGGASDPGNRAQDLSSDLGKILRLDPRTGAGAAGNPFAGHPKVWAFGLRNPWRFAFDTNGDLYLGDVGQNEVEELDVVRPAQQSGANYGWSVYEGTTRFKRATGLTAAGHLVQPVLTYTHAGGRCSITGGEVYRGSALPALAGTYVFGDYCAGRLLGVTRTAGGVTASRALGPRVDGLQGFGHDVDGELLVLSSSSLWRLVRG